MTAGTVPASLRSLHPLHGILLGFPFPLFLGALLSDVAYWATFQIQWANFSSWLIAGGLLGSAFAVLFSLVDLFRHRMARDTGPLIYFILIVAAGVLGFVNALVHAKDAWATMPEGLILSVVTALFAFAAAWIGYSGFRIVEVR